MLVVEDNRLNLKVLTAMLTREDCDWQTAYDGQSGAEQANSQPFDLILMPVLVERMHHWLQQAQELT